MSNEYDMEGVHKYVRFTDALLQRDTYFNETADPTKMNVIVPIIPRPARDIMDLALLTTGVGLNALLGLSILLNSCMRTTANCYMTSLMCSNLIILIEPLQQVLRWIFDVRLVLNLDYVFLVTFDVSVLTITQLNIEAYVVICYKDSPLREPLLRISTAVKGVLLIWVICVMLTCTELHLYEHFEEEVMYDICVSSTVIFLMFPCFIFLMLDYFILHDLVTTRSADGTWPNEDVERFVLLANVTVGFVLFEAPYRVVRSVTLITSSCCNDLTVEIVYTMVKMHPTILPLTCFAISAKFRRALKEALRCRRREIAATA